MKRLPLLGFGAMAAATILAFFLVQHIKVLKPVVWGQPGPIPAVFNPVSGRICASKNHTTLDYRFTKLAFRVPKAGTVAVYVINAEGSVVATVSNGRYLSASPNGAGPEHVFRWNGRESNGQIAPDGTYFFRISLLDQDKTSDLSGSPITIKTQPTQPQVTSVSLTGSKTATAGGTLVLTPPHGTVTVDFKSGDYRRAWIDVYRTDVPGKPKLINEFRVKNRLGDSAVWNGDRANGEPAPAGTYLIGMKVQDEACNRAVYPTVMPPAAGTTHNLGVDVRYLTATPPLTPTTAGTRAAVKVQSPTGPYVWKLRLAGERKVLREGTGVGGDSTLRVWLPADQAALYKLTLTADGYAASVPLVASGTNARATSARVLVALPMLSWEGDSEVDDSGDGLPSTLSAGDRASLARPLVGGLPASFGQDAALISYLNGQHLRYQLTTDIALAENQGPSLVDRWGVLLADETWLPAPLVGILKGFVEGGGRALAIGPGALRGSAAISGYPSEPVAAAPSDSRTDLFGATHGPLTAIGSDVITELTDDLGLLSEVPELSGFTKFEPIEPPGGVKTSAAGIAQGAPAVVIFRVGGGYAAEIGLDGFDSTLAGNIDAQELMGRLWTLLAK